MDLYLFLIDLFYVSCSIYNLEAKADIKESDLESIEILRSVIP